MLYHLSYIPSTRLVETIYINTQTLGDSDVSHRGTECRGVVVCVRKMHRVGFEPTRFATVVLETTPLDHSGTDAHSLCRNRKVFRTDQAVVVCVKVLVCVLVSVSLSEC